MQQEKTLIQGEFDALSVAREIVDVAADKKANDITLLDLREVTTLADFFVIATGTSSRQIGAISSGIAERTKEEGVPLLATEGRSEDGWVLLDYGQIIVHVFGPEERAYYDLERRWRDAHTLLRMQ